MLPQLHAFVLEALRWRPVAPLGMSLFPDRSSNVGCSLCACMPGFPHRATKDIIWVNPLDLLSAMVLTLLQRGLCIPAGATVFGCHWYVHHIA